MVPPTHTLLTTAVVLEALVVPLTLLTTVVVLEALVVLLVFVEAAGVGRGVGTLGALESVAGLVFAAAVLLQRPRVFRLEVAPVRRALQPVSCQWK